jgi:hypothetical protein
MDQELNVEKKGHKMLAVTIILVVILFVLVFGAALLQKPKIVSPLPDSDANSVRVIFVSPLASASAAVQPSATSSASPKTSPKSSPKSTPKASASASVQPTSTPR